MSRSYIITSLVLSAAFLSAHSRVISTSDSKNDFLLKEVTKWLSRTPVFQNCSSDEERSNMIDELISWKTPDYIVKHFPYYLAGLSYENLPIYVVESGKFDIVTLMRQGPEVVKNVDKALTQAFVRGFKTLEHGGPDGTNHHVYLILDFEGFTYGKFVSVPAVELLTRLFLQHMSTADNFVEKIYVINGNYAVDALYKMFRPIFGRLAERIEMYGPKKSTWKAVLRRELPLEALPPWYGGHEDFKPIATYG